MPRCARAFRESGGRRGLSFSFVPAREARPAWSRPPEWLHGSAGAAALARRYLATACHSRRMSGTRRAQIEPRGT